MSNYFKKVRNFILDLDLRIVSFDEREELFVVDDEKSGIKNLIIDCEDPILILEQQMFPVPNRAKETPHLFRRLLEMNRELVHGAFVLNSDASMVIFRDTLQLENLDLNELKGSVNALSLGLAEFGNELLGLSK